MRHLLWPQLLFFARYAVSDFHCSRLRCTSRSDMAWEIRFLPQLLSSSAALRQCSLAWLECVLTVCSIGRTFYGYMESESGAPVDTHPEYQFHPAISFANHHTFRLTHSTLRSLGLLSRLEHLQARYPMHVCTPLAPLFHCSVGSS
jgi:hypothetical protein